MTMAAPRLCYGRDPLCTGARPCQPCFEHQKGVIVNAMARVGLPAGLQAQMVQAFAAVTTESVYTLLMRQTVVEANPPLSEAELAAIGQRSEPPPAMPSPDDVMEAMEAALAEMDADALREVVIKIKDGTLEGLDLLPEEDREKLSAMAAEALVHKVSGETTAPEKVEEAAAASSTAENVSPEGAAGETGREVAQVVSETEKPSATAEGSEG